MLALTNKPMANGPQAVYLKSQFSVIALRLWKLLVTQNLHFFNLIMNNN